MRRKDKKNDEATQINWQFPKSRQSFEGTSQEAQEWYQQLEGKIVLFSFQLIVYGIAL